jgi:hypothetical protein
MNFYSNEINQYCLFLKEPYFGCYLDAFYSLSIVLDSIFKELEIFENFHLQLHLLGSESALQIYLCIIHLYFIFF